MSEAQKEVLQQALGAVTTALQAGVNPDVLMDSIIQKTIELGKVTGVAKSFYAETTFAYDLFRAVDQ
jgi:hypothetical protein